MTLSQDILNEHKGLETHENWTAISSLLDVLDKGVRPGECMKVMDTLGMFADRTFHVLDTYKEDEEIGFLWCYKFGDINLGTMMNVKAPMNPDEAGQTLIQVGRLDESAWEVIDDEVRDKGEADYQNAKAHFVDLDSHLETTSIETILNKYAEMVEA